MPLSTDLDGKIVIATQLQAKFDSKRLTYYTGEACGAKTLADAAPLILPYFLLYFNSTKRSKLKCHHTGSFPPASV